jgi:hypothetical protein
MVKRTAVLLGMLVIGCGGGTSSTDTHDAVILGTWVVTFSSNSSCSLSQIAFSLTESGTGAPTGSHGSYAIDCPGMSQDQEPQGPISGWNVNGNHFSIQVATNQNLLGTVSGSSLSGTFTWGNITGSFTAVKQ